MLYPIEVSVKTIYLDQHSNNSEHQHVWAYHITIENRSDDQIQLLNRHWKISDSEGITREVKGEGVVGKQPVLEPGEVFEYTSSTILQSPSGLMFGYYEMQTTLGRRFFVDIPAFSLDAPGHSLRLH